MYKTRLTFIIKYPVIALVAALVLYFSTNPLIDAPTGDMIIDGITAGLLLGLLLFLLEFIVRYGNYSSMARMQQIINYSFLGIVFSLLWVGGSFYLTHLLLSPERDMLFLPVIPIRIVISFLIYGFSILFFQYSLNNNTDYKDTTEEAADDEPEESIEEDTAIANTIDHIAVKNGQKIDLVYISDIIYIQAEGDYVMIYGTNGKYLKEQTMKSLENSLPKNKFVRVHRSSIVNVDYIQRIELFDKQSQILFLKSGLQVKTSIAGYRLLKNTLNL